MIKLKDLLFEDASIADGIRWDIGDDGDINSAGIHIEPDNGDNEIVPTDVGRKTKIRKVFGIPIFTAYEVSRGAEKTKSGQQLLNRLRHILKHPESDQKGLVDTLIENSVKSMSEKIDLSKISVIIPLGSKSLVNVQIAEEIKKIAGVDIPILKDFIVKDVWKNVKLRNIKEDDHSQGYKRALQVLQQKQAQHGQEPFEIKKAGPGQNLRRYFSFFYKTTEGYPVDLSQKITNGNVLIVDDTLEMGSTLIESLRVIKEFEPKTVTGYIFLFGRYGGG